MEPESASHGTHDGSGSTRGRAAREPESPAASPELGGRKGQKRQHVAEEEVPDEELEAAVPKKLNTAKETKPAAARAVVPPPPPPWDGEPAVRCSGICTQWNKEEKRARVLTSYRVVFCTRDDKLYDPTPKLAVHLPDMESSEARLLFFDENYQLALLEISVNAPSYELELPSFGYSPYYGQVHRLGTKTCPLSSIIAVSCG
ncbi:hypothetical protein SETIT_3G099800v2 [Setaria italica]|uniref:Uncharacterized protein n=1 Tax=Setaria italica TaxID=4555 RepID=A0A368QE37_SETIT|nr:hypothetical protein SETIT_3G099800v2 [Setaria italica]